MAKVIFTRALKRFYPNLDTLEIKGDSVADILNGLDHTHPGLKDYLVDERGNLRTHVNIFIGDQLIKDAENLRDEVAATDEVFIMQALSGG